MIAILGSRPGILSSPVSSRLSFHILLLRNDFLVSILRTQPTFLLWEGYQNAK